MTSTRTTLIRPPAMVTSSSRWTPRLGCWMPRSRRVRSPALNRSIPATVALLIGVALSLTACGEATPAVPDLPAVSVPNADLPDIPAELPDANVDAAQAKQLICQAGNAWLTADGTQRKLVEPLLRRVTGHYRESTDETVKNLAIAGDSLLDAKGATRDAAAAEFRKHCGH